MKLDHDEFAAFWSSYPRRTAKIDAMKSYVKARKLASAEDILAGVERYKQHLPDEVRFICHPATWLNQGRWMDEEDEPQVRRPHVCPHDPPCGDTFKEWCLTRQWSEKQRETA